MTNKARELSNKHDELFQKHEGTLCTKSGDAPRCGYPAIMDFVRKTGESLPLTPERMRQIEAYIAKA